MRVMRPLRATVLVLAASAGAAGLTALGCGPRGRPTSEEEAPPRQATRLLPGVGHDETMGPGERHPYLVEARAGHFVRLVVDQQGIDVSLLVADPAGGEPIRVDSPTGRSDAESIGLLAPESPTTFRVEVVSGTDEPAGAYRIAVTVHRPATPADRQQADGEWTFARARQRQRGKTADSRRQGLNLFAEAEQHFAASGDLRRQAESFRRLAGVSTALGDLGRALSASEGALALYTETGDAEGEGKVLNSIGLLYRRFDRLSEAFECHERAREIGRRLGKEEIVRVARQNLANLHSDLGDLEEALQIYRKLHEEWQGIGRQDMAVRTLYSIGYLYLSLGAVDEAESLLHRALSTAEELDDDEVVVEAMVFLARIRRQSGDAAAARPQLERALGEARRRGLQFHEGLALNELGQTYVALEAWARAEETLREALALFRQQGSPRGEAAVLVNLGWLAHETGDWRESLRLHDEALALFERGDDRSGMASAHYGAARALAGRGELHLALDRVETALRLVEELRGRIQAESHRASFFAARQDYYDLYIDILMRLDATDRDAGFAARAFEASERRRARSLLDLLGQAKRRIEKGIEPDLLAREKTLWDQIRLAVVSLLHQESPGERGPEQAPVAGDRPSLDQEIDALIAEYESLEGEIRSRSPRYAALTQPRILNLTEVQSELLDDATQLVAYSLGEERSYVWLVSRNGLVSRTLRPRREIEQIARRLHDLLSTSWDMVENDRAALLAAELAGAVLEPVAPWLHAERLVVVPDGALHYIPFAVLPLPAADGPTQGQRPSLLMDRFEVVDAPSASVLALLRQQAAKRQPPSGSIAVLADPVFQPDDERVHPGTRTASPAPASVPRRAAERGAAGESRSLAGLYLENLTRLRHSRDEARAILSLVPPGQGRAFLGFSARREAVLGGALSGYRIVHLATHGFIDPQHPRLSGVALSLVDESGEPQDGFLHLVDIYNLELSAELVVISSCQSALGREVRGEGMVGLTRGFMYAGTPRLVVSLWKVDDRATALLMERFYDLLLNRGLSPASALRQAQLSLRRDGWRPYYWAGFILQGEWR